MGLLRPFPRAKFSPTHRSQAAAGIDPRRAKQGVGCGGAKEVVGVSAGRPTPAQYAHPSGGVVQRSMALRWCSGASRPNPPPRKTAWRHPHGGSAMARTVLRPAWPLPSSPRPTRTHCPGGLLSATLAPPERRQPKDPQVLRGQALFAQARAASIATAGWAAPTTGKRPDVPAPEHLDQRPAHSNGLAN
jgi:hypothetical protein